MSLIAVIAVLATSQLAVALVNWLATLLVTPRAIPRMDFSSGIPAASSALVVIPTMITSTDNIDDLVEALEVRFLANRDENLRFGLLTDFRDAAAESMPEDGALLEHASRRIDALNALLWRRCILPASTALGDGTRASASGWDSSASAASSPTSTGCCAKRARERVRAVLARRRQPGGCLPAPAT